jgi:hypothetical protein
MEETYYLGVSDPLNLYGVCKVWHTGVLKVLVGSENRLLSAMALESGERLKWFFEQESILSLPEKSQVISIASANPLMIGKRNSGEGNGKIARRCLIGVTYSIPAPVPENPPPEPEATPVAKPPPSRPVGPNNSFVSRILQIARPPPQAPTKPTESTPQVLTPSRFFFSILGANSFETDHWSTIVQDNITFELPYVPFVLAKYAPPNSSSVLFMLSGSDRKLHIFNQHADVDPEDAESAADTPIEGSNQDEKSKPENHAPASLHLPLLEYYPSPVVSIDVLDALDGQIHVVAGCQDGSVVLSSGDSSGALTRHITTCLDGPITSVKIYQVARNRWRGTGTMIPTENDQTNPKSTTHPSIRRLHKHIHRSSQNKDPSSPSSISSPLMSRQAPSNPSQAKIEVPDSSSDSSSRNGTFSPDSPIQGGHSAGVTKEEKNEFGINIVVASAIGFAAVFRNVTENDFNDFHLLPDSDKHDAVLGIAVGDVDQDGHTEILLGTYGQRVLAYAETKGKGPTSSTSSIPSTSNQPASTPKRTNSSNSAAPLRSSNSKSSVISSSSTFSPYNQGLRSEITQSTTNQGLFGATQSSASILGPSAPRSPLAPSNDTKPSHGLRDASSSIRDVRDGVIEGDEDASLRGAVSSGSKGLSSVGMGFAKILDEKKQEYMRENVVSSVSDLAKMGAPSNSTMNTAGREIEQGFPSGSILGFQGTVQVEIEPPTQTHCFSLLWRKSFNDPVYQIMCDDFFQDGSMVVIASTMYGIHLLRSDSQNVSLKANRRLQLLSDIIKLERQLYRLEKTHTKSISNSSGLGGGLTSPPPSEPPSQGPSPSPSSSDLSVPTNI